MSRETGRMNLDWETEEKEEEKKQRMSRETGRMNLDWETEEKEEEKKQRMSREAENIERRTGRMSLDWETEEKEEEKTPESDSAFLIPHGPHKLECETNEAKVERLKKETNAIIDETKKIEHDHAAHDNEMYALQEKIDASNKRKKAFLNKNKEQMEKLGIKDENIKAFVEKLKEQRTKLKEQVEAKNNEFEDLNANIADNEYEEKNVKELLKRENARLSSPGVTDFEVTIAVFEDDLVVDDDDEPSGYRYIFNKVQKRNGRFEYTLNEDVVYRDILKNAMIGSFSMESKKWTVSRREKHEQKQQELTENTQFWNNIHIIETRTFTEYANYGGFFQGMITIQCPKGKVGKLKKLFKDWYESMSSPTAKRDAEENARVLVLSKGVKTVPAVQEKPYRVGLWKFKWKKWFMIQS
eukprot:1064435_1